MRKYPDPDPHNHLIIFMSFSSFFHRLQSACQQRDRNTGTAKRQS